MLIQPVLLVAPDIGFVIAGGRFTAEESGVLIRIDPEAVPFTVSRKDGFLFVSEEFRQLLPPGERSVSVAESEIIDDVVELLPELVGFQRQSAVFPGGIEFVALPPEIDAKPSDLPGLSHDLCGLRVEIEAFAAGPWFELSLHGMLLSFF